MVRLVFLIATVVAMTAAQQQLCTQIQTAHPAMITVFTHLPHSMTSFNNATEISSLCASSCFNGNVPVLRQYVNAGCVHEANPINVTQNLTAPQMNAFIDMIIGYACVKNEHNQYCAAAMLSFSSSVNGGGSTDTTPSPAEMCRDIVLFEQVTGCCAGNALAVDHTFEAAGMFPSSAQTMMKSFFAHCALQIPAICSGTASEVAGGVPGATNGLNTGGTGNSANTKQSAGAIAGIVIGAVALVGVAVLGGAYVMHTKKAAPTGYSPTYDYAAST